MTSLVGPPKPRCTSGSTTTFEQFDMGFTEAIDLVTGRFDLPQDDVFRDRHSRTRRLARSSVTVALSGTGRTSSSRATTGIGRIVCAGSSDASPHRCARGDPDGGWTLSGPAEHPESVQVIRRSASSGATDGVIDQYLELVAGATSSEAEQGLHFSVDREASRA